MLTALKFRSLRNIFCSLFLLFSVISHAQTPGLIIRPAGGPYNSVLDKNTDGFTSPTNSGFVTTDVGAGYSEIPYKVVPPFKLEPTSDLMRGPNTLFSDLVRISNDESGMYIFNDGTNMLFRLRLGSIVSGSKGYSILIDADGLFGASGPYADPNYKPATTGINGNPGFEIEVVLETNFRVAIYDVDGKDDAGTTAASTYGINTNSQISIAYSTVSENPDYLYDFYVPLADLKYAGGTKSVTATTPIRVSATTVMSPQASIGGPKSDIYGYDGTDYMKAWETIINGQPSFTPNDVKSTGSGITSTICTAAPTLNSPIGTGTVSITGTWTQADATRPSSATITLYKNGVAWPTTTTVSTGNTWTITNVTSSINDVFYAKAQASGESSCLQSSSLTAISCVTLPTSPVVSCYSKKGISGTIPAGTTALLYKVPVTTASPTSDPKTTNFTSGSGVFNYYDCQASGNPLTDGDIYMILTSSGGCVSAPTFVCIPSGNGTVPITLTANSLSLTTPIFPSQTSISGTGSSNGQILRLFINDQYINSIQATGTSFTFSGLSLNANDKIKIYGQVSGSCMTVSSQFDVSNCNSYVQPPVITVDNSGYIKAGNNISGTSNEAVGTTIKVYNAATSALVATTTVQSGGTWNSGVAAIASNNYYAVASTSCGTSVNSATFASVSGNATTRCFTITSPVTESANSVSGTLSGTAVTNTKVRLLADGYAIDSATTNNNVWSIPVNTTTSNIIYPGAVLTVEVQEPSKFSEVCSASVTVACVAPSNPSGFPTTVALSNSNGQTTFTISNSESNVLYTLEDLSGVDKSTSVFGNNGSITLTSYAFLTPGTYDLRVSTLKLSGSNCGTSSTDVTLTVGDNDGDGIADVVDIDDDNDGILDTNETASGDATGDADGDGVLNYRDANYCTLNSNNVCANLDQDRDGIINQFDLDADNDGIPDIVENGGTDSDNDGKVDGATDVDADGLRDAVDANTSGASGSNGITVLDFDSDSVPNFKDLDTDGDGILDSRESGLGLDTNNNGVLNDDASYVGGTDGWSDAVDVLSSLNLTNTDGRGTQDFRDIDSDDDGIVDIIEAQLTTSYQAPLNTDSDGDGIDDRYDNNTSSFGGNSNNGLTPVNTDGTDLADYLDGDSDNDGYPDTIEGHDTDGDNIPNTGSPANNGIPGGTTDADGDGLLDGYDNNTSSQLATNSTVANDYPNMDGSTSERDWREAANTDVDGLTNLTDIDDDNDGITDLLENGGVNPLGDADSDGVYNYLDPTPGGIVPAFTDANGDGINDEFDKDLDGVINSLDLDIDNDGIPDLVEAGGVDTNGDGQVDVSTDTDGDGLSDTYDSNNGGVALTNLDTDGDGIANAHDLDSDNDGIADVVEAGGTDANNDGRLDAAALAGWDTNGDGLADAVTGTTDALIITGADTNNDGSPNTYPRANLDGAGMPNPYDLDSDGDSILDAREANAPDSDNNGIVNGAPSGGGDTNGWSNVVDGNSGGTVLSIPNTDGTEKANYLDIDSDDDGITDNVEGQSTIGYILPTGVDIDGDGIDDAYDNNDALFGGAANNGITPYDYDGDLLSDYVDLNTDNDTQADRVEGNDFNDNGMADDMVTLSGSDTDKDGLDNIFEIDPSNGPIVTISGFLSGTGGKSPAQKKSTELGADRDWRNADFTLSDAVLPVRFVSFNAAKQSNGVQLIWNVTAEVNVKSYEVEKSTDGSRFSKIGEVPFKASADAMNKYQFFDGPLASNTTYYRIRQVDIDGKFMFSSVVSLSANETGSKLTVHPNPVYSEASIVLGVKSNQKTMLVVCDMQGKILTRRNVELQKGQNVIPADLFPQLPSGTYILMAKADGTLLLTRFVKQ
jgi:hypothetical protein